MKKIPGKYLRVLMFALIALSMMFQGSLVFGEKAKAPAPKASDTILKSMGEELTRSMKVLKEKGNPAPYFIQYRVTDSNKVGIIAANGSIQNSYKDRSRLLDVKVRVGSYKQDNTHQIKGSYFDLFSAFSSFPVSVTVEDDADALKNAIWMETDKKYKDACERLIQIEGNKSVSVKDEDQSDDFSQEKPEKYSGQVVSVNPDMTTWEKKIKEYSAIFNEYPEIYTSSVQLTVEAENKYLVNNEGSSIQQGLTHWRIMAYATSKAEDGMELSVNDYFDSYTEGNLPDEKTIKESIKNIAKNLLALRKAPVLEPFTGPAILSGRASAVFFHEIFGHRIEGHRQKDESEGQTFAKMLNQSVLPEFISVYDDPSIPQYEKQDLNGYYLYDDEGVKAQRANLVENGILKSFLMSRSPINNFPKSNGHGRAEAGMSVVARQGVLVMESTKKITWEALRQALIDECKKQEKPYGLIFDDIDGGMTNTRRGGMQAFSVIPTIVYKVYTDGRPDELVRGVDMVGTPLTTFSKIIACGDKPAVFNGYCGAESGSVPASCISLPILTSQIEVQKKTKSTDKPPVLPPPDRR